LSREKFKYILIFLENSDKINIVNIPKSYFVYFTLKNTVNIINKGANMAENEDFYIADELPVALIIAGIDELEEHGLHDFSLRRVANRCGVSCAAPYRHFQNKDALILAIIAYVNKQWAMLGEQVIAAYEGDVKRQIIEVCMANVRFWNANPSFRYIMLLDKSSLENININERNHVGGMLRELVGSYCAEKKMTCTDEERLYFSTRAILYGSAQMLATGELENTHEGLATVRACLENLFFV